MFIKALSGNSHRVSS